MERGGISFGEYADQIRGCITAALTGTSTYGQSGSRNKSILVVSIILTASWYWASQFDATGCRHEIPS